ncbi:hypothetical protein I4F81_009807 [Pyropia yezoensis]|uniref:Uncharacterized protein n=1 Tax=Pyropia yezoensis TaxID=2788 RepID=A0ACC3CAP6_PYRYE|nr:hypothetical protein I4F81_009807 [Neopyropia yezoensis]
MAKGAYDAPIPNAVMTLGLSGRPLSCSSPVTPRLQVEVPAELQRTICPWLEAEEAAYSRRLSENSRNTDEALVNPLSSDPLSPAEENATAILAAGTSAQKAASEEFAALRSEIAQLRAVVSQLLPSGTATAASPARAVLSGTRDGTAALKPAGSTSRTLCGAAGVPPGSRVEPSVRQPPPTPPAVSSVWLKDRQTVNELQVLRKLEGARIANDGKRCVLLVGMEANLCWEKALD